jgi:putative ABC transport system substrate-binding protein
MKRREFITLLSGAAAWPLAAGAQQAEPVRRVGALFGYSPFVHQSDIAVFRERLAMPGWVEGGNLRIDYCFAGGDPDRLAAYAEELVNLRPGLIFAITGAATRAVQQRTAAIPIVFVGSGDPVSAGLVGNIARPGGNVTGFANNFGSLGGKWLELFKEAVPGLTRVAQVLALNPFRPDLAEVAGNANPRNELLLDAAAARLGVTMVRIRFNDTAEIEPAISAFAAAPHGGLLVMGGAARAVERLALHYRLPLMVGNTFVAEDVLMSHGSDSLDLVRRAASYVDRSAVRPAIEMSSLFPVFVQPDGRLGNFCFRFGLLGPPRPSQPRLIGGTGVARDLGERPASASRVAASLRSPCAEHCGNPASLQRPRNHDVNRGGE